VLCDTSAIDAELMELHREIEVVTELSRKAISEIARTANEAIQGEWVERNNGYLERHRQATARISELETQKMERIGKAKTLDSCIREIRKRPLAVTEFDEQLWLAVIYRVTVGGDGEMTFRFRIGIEVRV